MKYVIRALLLLLIIAFYTSCSQKKDFELVGQHMAGVDTRINRILVNKYAFEKAIVKVRGKVKNLSMNTENNNIIFELTDRKGNFINILTDKENDITEDDYIILNGEYNSTDNSLIMYEYEKFPI